jgi:uncharacterized membrane protein
MIALVLTNKRSTPPFFHDTIVAPNRAISARADDVLVLSFNTMRSNTASLLISNEKGIVMTFVLCLFACL